jgi:hypothetical protein
LNDIYFEERVRNLLLIPKVGSQSRGIPAVRLFAALGWLRAAQLALAAATAGFALVRSGGVKPAIASSMCFKGIFEISLILVRVQLIFLPISFVNHLTLAASLSVSFLRNKNTASPSYQSFDRFISHVNSVSSLFLLHSSVSFFYVSVSFFSVSFSFILVWFFFLVKSLLCYFYNK